MRNTISRRGIGHIHNESPSEWPRDQGRGSARIWIVVLVERGGAMIATRPAPAI